MASEYIPFKKLLKKYGMKLDVAEGGHMGIYKGERRIYTMAATPTQAYHAVQNTVRDLVLAEELPNGLIYRGRIYKRKRGAKTLHD